MNKQTRNKIKQTNKKPPGWVLLTCSGDEFCDLLPALHQAMAYYLPTVGLLAFPVLFTDSSWRLALCLPHFFGALIAIPPFLLCASFQFIVYSDFFFVDVSVCPGGYAGLPQRWLGEYCMTLGAHLFGLPNVSQAGLELVSGGGGSPPVFSV
jgi:hypothetical protein